MVLQNERPFSSSVNFLELEERLAAEMLLVTHSIGLLPGKSPADLTRIHDVLELGCGSGTWSLEMAQRYGHMRITGIDSDRLLVAHANRRRDDRQLSNVQYFYVRDFTGPFAAFADHSFDLISGQFLSRVLYREDWPAVLRECWRLLRPGGWIRLTDFETAISNAPAHEEMWQLFIRAMRMHGRGFSPNDRHLGLLCSLEPLLVQAGFRHTSNLAHFINYSFGAPLHQEWSQELLRLARSTQPLLVKAGVSTHDSLQDLWRRQEHEMKLCSFRAVLPIITVWGRRSAEPLVGCHTG